MASFKKKDITALQHLLKAPRKEAVAKMCNQAIMYKDMDPNTYPESAVGEVSFTLSITKGESRQVLRALSIVLQRAMFLYATNPDSASTVFPDDFHKNLKDLILTILARSFSEWKTIIISGNTSLPRLLDVNWRVDNSELTVDSLNLPTQANCILQLKIDGDGPEERGEKSVDVMLTSEKLNAMLDGLGKIKDQLEAVSNR